MTAAVVLVAHGTVDDLDELPAFVARIRRGHAAPPELVAELRRRYEAIGGKSPLNAINRSLAAKVERALGVPTRLANRLAAPSIDETLAALKREGIDRVVAVPLAQYSAHVYAEAVEKAAKAIGIAAVSAKSWAHEPRLIAAYADAANEALAGLDRSRTTLALTAHSLPVAAIRAGDPYEREVRRAADEVAARVDGVHRAVAFQSQGMSGPGVEWLGPDLLATIDAAKGRGDANVVFAPIGFLADHVEVLYDLDVEARAWVEGRGMTYRRARSPNDGDALVQVIADVARPLLDHG